MMTKLETRKAEYDAKQKSGKGRTRHVWDDDMVAHIWAHQSQDDARNARNTFYFRGATIWSYGSHFPIATHCTSKRGEKFVLFTTKGYSSTTSGHKNVTLAACRHLKIVYAPEVAGRWGSTEMTAETHAANLKAWDEEIPYLIGKAVRAKANKQWYLSKLESLIANANEYSRLFGLRKRFKMPPVDMDEMKRQIAEIEKREAARRAKALKEQEKREAEQRVKDQAAADAWLKGEGSHFPYSHRENGNVRLRVNGENIETSLGAEVPLKHALKILPLARSGKEYRRNGHTIHLGHFALDEITADGRVVAGCHTIRREEIERVAATIGA